MAIPQWINTSVPEPQNRSKHPGQPPFPAMLRLESPLRCGGAELELELLENWHVYGPRLRCVVPPCTLPIPCCPERMGLHQHPGSLAGSLPPWSTEPQTGGLPSKCTHGNVPSKAARSCPLSPHLALDGILMPFNVSGPKNISSAQITLCTLWLPSVCASPRALRSLIKLVSPNLPPSWGECVSPGVKQ